MFDRRLTQFKRLSAWVGFHDVTRSRSQELLFTSGIGTVLFSVAVGSIIFLTLTIQALVTLNGDVGWLLHSADRWLNGAELYGQIYETNPPMIYLITAPARWVQTWLAVSPVGAAKIYFLTIAGLVYWLHIRLFQQLLPKKNLLFYLPASLVILLLLPAHEFGQRDHLAIIFLLPYFFSRLAGSMGRSVPLPYRIGAGLLLGVAVSLKHYFLLFPLFTELWLWLVMRKPWRFLWSIEVLVGGLVGVAFAVFVIGGTAYVSNVLPWVRLFYPEFIVPLATHNHRLPLYFAVLLMNLAGAVGLKGADRRDLSLFLVGLSGVGLIVFMLQVHFFYQLRPFLSLVLLTWALLALFYFEQYPRLRRFAKLLIILSLFILLASCAYIVGTRGSILWHAAREGRLPTRQESGDPRLAENIAIINQNFSGQPVYTFTTGGILANMLANYTESVYVSGLMHHWMLPAIDRAERFGGTLDPKRRKAILAAKPRYLQLVEQEIATYQPVAILVDKEWKYTAPGFSFERFVRENPSLQERFAQYESVGIRLRASEMSIVEVLVRKDLAHDLRIGQVLHNLPREEVP